MVSAKIADFPLGVFNLCQKFLCPLDEKQPRVRRHNPPVISVQEKFSHSHLQFLNLHAQGRLGDMAVSSSFAETSKLRDRQIISQLSYVHIPSVPFL